MAALHAQVEAPWDKPWSEKAYSDLLNQPSVYAFALFHEESLRSFIVVQYGDPTLDILYITTHPDDRGKGYGKKVYTYMLEDMQKIHSVNVIMLEVCEKNHPALHFYKHLGFTHTYTRKNYYTQNNSLFFNAFVLINNTIENY